MTNLIIFEAQNEHWRTEIATSEQQILLFDLPSIINGNHFYTFILIL